MSVGRRRLLLPLAFLGIAICFTSASVARAQGPGERSHRLWNDKLTPEQIKAALAKLSLGGDDGNGPLHKMLVEHMMKQDPRLSKELLDPIIKKMLSDPSFLEKARMQAQERQTEPGRTPKFTQEDLEKLSKLMPRGTDPKKFPDDPKVQPQPAAPPPNKRPRPTTPPADKRPPVGQVPPEPGELVPPKETVRPQGGPPRNVEDPRIPAAPPGMGVQAPPPPRTPEDTLFRPPDEPTDPRTKSLQAFAAVWERNIGPLDQTPEVKRALFDLASSANGLDLDLLDDKGNSIWDLIRKGDGSGMDFGDFMDGSGGNWKLPNMDFPSFKLGSWFGRTTPRPGSSRSSWSWGSSSPRVRGPSTGGGGFGSFGFGGSWFPVVVLAIIALAILLWVLLKNLRTPTPQLAYVMDGLGPWPVDPRRINTREDVVKAFEYLSVLICGVKAKTWTHNTIADALADLAATHGETAAMLARLYELARYAPLDEPLSHEELMEARELVCGLAGVSY
jgi:hypothetical protein